MSRRVALYYGLQYQGRRQKKFPEGGRRKKDRKIAKNIANSTIKPLPGGTTEKRSKKSKKDRKIAL